MEPIVVGVVLVEECVVASGDGVLADPREPLGEAFRVRAGDGLLRPLLVVSEDRSDAASSSLQGSGVRV